MEEGLMDRLPVPQPNVTLAPKHHGSTGINEFLDEEDLLVLPELERRAEAESRRAPTFTLSSKSMSP